MFKSTTYLHNFKRDDKLLTTPEPTNFITAINNLDGEIWLEKHSTLLHAKDYIKNFFAVSYRDTYYQHCKEQLATNDLRFLVSNIYNDETKSFNCSMFNYTVTILSI